MADHVDVFGYCWSQVMDKGTVYFDRFILQWSGNIADVAIARLERFSSVLSPSFRADLDARAERSRQEQSPWSSGF